MLKGLAFPHFVIYCQSEAQWVEHWICDPRVVGLIPNVGNSCVLHNCFVKTLESAMLTAPLVTVFQLIIHPHMSNLY